jgi:hypothetical protein
MCVVVTMKLASSRFPATRSYQCAAKNMGAGKAGSKFFCRPRGEALSGWLLG